MAALLSMMLKILQFLILVLSVHKCYGARILAFYVCPVQSHMNLKSSFLRELVDRGHHVTAVTSIPEKTSMTNYDEIIIPGVKESLKQFGNGNMFVMREQNPLLFGFRASDSLCSMCEKVLREPQIQELINARNIHFDLIISEAYISDCVLPFSYKFKAPTVKFVTLAGSAWMFDWVGNPHPFSHVPDMCFDYSDKMSFTERVWNTIQGTVTRVERRFHHLPRINEIVRKFFNTTEHLPSIWELEDTTTSLILVNNHFSISYPRPLLPNVIQVGGLHIKPPKKLPQDIEKFLNEAPHGVIYFSMGSLLQSTNLPDCKIKAFLEAFSKLKETILWKWEAETLPGQPSNVKLGKWLPQSDILAHPNVRAFMTHGGLLSSQETIDRGVPIVGIPIFADQVLNMAKAKKAGYGILLDFHNISTESVIWALREVLDNPVYRENAQHTSRIYRDKPHQPLDEAVFWTEYVIRHKGAPHMRSAALDLTWYQYFLLDVIAVLVLAVVSIIFIVFVLIVVILRVWRNARSQKIMSVDRKNN